MTRLEEAQSALKEYKRSVAEGHPWVPGGMFNRNPGLEDSIMVAFEEYVRTVSEKD